MRRREFITLLGGSVTAAWPLAARAQQRERMRALGCSPRGPRTIGNGRLAWQPFVRVYRSWDGSWGHHRDRAPRRSGRQRIFAPERAELVVLAPDAIVVNGNSPLMPLLQATRQVPVVFVNVSDPVGAGFVASLARPGGNATGFTLFEFGMSGKWLELLKQIAPGLRAACSSHSIGARR